MPEGITMSSDLASDYATYLKDGGGVSQTQPHVSNTVGGGETRSVLVSPTTGLMHITGESASYNLVLDISSVSQTLAYDAMFTAHLSTEHAAAFLNSFTLQDMTTVGGTPGCSYTSTASPPAATALLNALNSAVWTTTAPSPATNDWGVAGQNVPAYLSAQLQYWVNGQLQNNVGNYNANAALIGPWTAGEIASFNFDTTGAAVTVDADGAASSAAMTCFNNDVAKQLLQQIPVYNTAQYNLGVLQSLPLLRGDSIVFGLVTVPAKHITLTCSSVVDAALPNPMDQTDQSRNTAGANVDQTQINADQLPALTLAFQVSLGDGTPGTAFHVDATGRFTAADS